MTNLNPTCCPDLAEKISAFIDDELTDSLKEEVQLHLDLCTNCNETYEIELFIKRKVYESNKTIQTPEQVVTWIREELMIINYKDDQNNG